MIFRNLFSQPAAQEPSNKKILDAVTTLFAEVIRSDFNVASVDLEVTRKILMDSYEIDENEADHLIKEALSVQKRPTSYYYFIQVLNKGLSYSEKVALIDSFWKIALADKTIDKYEDHAIRKFADLMHVSHKDFINKKNLRIKEGKK